MEQNEEPKIKVYFRKFKQLWNDKRYRSIMILLLYFIFFAVIFSMFDLNKSVSRTPYNEFIKFENYDVYEFSTNISINSFIYSINGKRYKDKYSFDYNGEHFVGSYEDIFLSNWDKNIINTFRFTPDLINNLMANSILISEKKIIADDSVIKEYALDIDKFLQVLDYNLLDYNLLDRLTITISEIDKQIVRVELNLSNFYKYLEEDYLEYIIVINYSNINNVYDIK